MEGPGLVYSGRVSGSNWYCNIRIHDYAIDDTDDEFDKNDDTDDNEDDINLECKVERGYGTKANSPWLKDIDLFISKFLV